MTFPIDALEQAFENTRRRIHTLETDERANFAGGVETILFSNLPTPGQTGRMFFVSDGRKLGEGVGAGTGVLVYDDAVAWRRTSDDTTVAV